MARSNPRSPDEIAAPGDTRGGGDRALLRASLRHLAAEVQATLPPLSALIRSANHPSSQAPWVRWAPTASSEGAALVLALSPDDLTVTAGFSARGRDHADRRPRLGELARRKREFADVLPTLLAALRSEGATLHAHRESDEALPELDWLSSVAAGAIRFRASDPVHGAADLVDLWRSELTARSPQGATTLLARWVAERLARLLEFWSPLLGWRLPPAIVSSGGDRSSAVRSLRWDERAFGPTEAPASLLPAAEAWCYDPVTGWFAPERFTTLSPPTLAHARWTDGGAPLAGEPTALRRSADPALLSRWIRWMRARESDVDDSIVRRTQLLVPSPHRDGDGPPLDALIASVLADPSGDLAVALSGLLEGAPWTVAPEPAVVASKVRPRWSLRAATGASRLADLGLLDASGWSGVRECLGDPVVRPLLWLAARRALGDLQCVPAASLARFELRYARPWEIVPSMLRPATLEEVARRFERSLRAEGLRFELDLLRAVLVGLRTRPFAVFAGVSGTGKTRLALRLAQFVTGALPGGPGPRVAVVSVRPDWIDSRGLLGYLNVMRDPPGYELTPALRLLLRAAAHPTEPHFLILDEMNLARPEHYLAELLSAMESGAPIDLHGRVEPVEASDRSGGVPSSVRVGANVIVLGTINVDETTHPLSAKVLDRAWLWEFPPAAPSSLLGTWIDPAPAEEPASETERLALMPADTDRDPTRTMLLAMGQDGVGATLDRLHAVMSAHGRPFGYRVVSEVLRFVDRCARDGLPVPPGWALDRALLGKVLPRWSGPRRELMALLKASREALEPHREPADPSSARSLREAAPAPSRPSLPLCLARLDALLERCAREDYVTFTR
jgi:MoxR-like ATPase